MTHALTYRETACACVTAHARIVLVPMSSYFDPGEGEYSTQSMPYKNIADVVPLYYDTETAPFSIPYIQPKTKPPANDQNKRSLERLLAFLSGL